MDVQDTEALYRLLQVLETDDIYIAYLKSAQALEEDFEAIAASLPRQQRQTLIGYSDCLKLMQLRSVVVAAENMRFIK